MSRLFVSLSLATALSGCASLGDHVHLPDTGQDVFVDRAGRTDHREEGIGEAAVEVQDMYHVDYDGDGFAPADGDCHDNEARINPEAVEVPGNSWDDDCDDETDEVEGGCDCAAQASPPEGLDLCDSRFLLAWQQHCLAPACRSGMSTLTRFGDPSNGLGPRLGCAYTVLSTGPVEIALCDPRYCPGGKRQPGTDFYEPNWGRCEMEGTPREPDPSPTGPDGTIICDTQQLRLDLRAPRNAVGFSFDFVYLTSEYPEWVGRGYNDTFYAILHRPATGERRNISFDGSGREIEVDTAFFEDPPVTNIDGTGYDGICRNEDRTYTACGSSTGWLRTSWNVAPGEEFSLTFSIHDEGDGIYDSTVVLDNFRWLLDPVQPGTTPI